MISRTWLFQRKDIWISSSKRQLLYHVLRRRFRSNVTLKRLNVRKRQQAIQEPSRQPAGTLKRISHSCVNYHDSIQSRTRKLQRRPRYTRRCWLDESLRRRNGHNTIPWMLGGPTTISLPQSASIMKSRWTFRYTTNKLGDLKSVSHRSRFVTKG